VVRVVERLPGEVFPRGVREPQAALAVQQEHGVARALEERPRVKGFVGGRTLGHARCAGEQPGCDVEHHKYVEIRNITSAIPPRNSSIRKPQRAASWRIRFHWS